MIKDYLKTTFTSYTLVILFQTIMFYFDNHDITNELVFEIFGACLLINLIIHIIHYLDLSNSLTTILSVLMIIIGVIASNYFLGNNNIIFEINSIIGIVVISIVVYFVVIGIVFVKNKDDEKKINQKLQRDATKKF